MSGTSLRIALAAALCGAILLPAAAAAQAPREAPTWSRGGSYLAISHDECLARLGLAAQSQDLTVVSNKAGVLMAKKAPHLVIMTCAFTADSRIDLNIIVASNNDAWKESAALRDALNVETKRSSCRATPWGFQHCYGKMAEK
jgi:hypothetical protein